MQITVLGASGNIGRRVVRQLLEQGADVRAMVYSTNPFESHAHLTVITGDVHNGADIVRALEGSQAVISALGSWGTAQQDILSSAMQHVIPYMESQGITRIVTVTGADALLPDESVSFLRRCTHWFFTRLAPRIMKDGETHMALLAASKLDWTTLRSPVMMNAKRPQEPRLSVSPPKPWQMVDRDAVAKALVTQLSDSSFSRQAPFVSSSTRAAN